MGGFSFFWLDRRGGVGGLVEGFWDGWGWEGCAWGVGFKRGGGVRGVDGDGGVGLGEGAGMVWKERGEYCVEPT